MSVLVESFPTSHAPIAESPAEAISRAAQPLLQEVPALLEYRSEADPDAEFIPKTVAGFSGGALLMGVCLDLAETLFVQHANPFGAMLPGMITRFAFMLGITGVSASLLLVGLKVRADHVATPLYARHWLNSIGTGAIYALMMFLPWVVYNHGITVNRFLAAVIMMAIMTFPAIAARWTIGPHRELPRP
ncbi:MAG TPA: hypothetical protein VHM90_03885 [Phycisphaerae bacterium]|jgi:hypothetical protein|nr:hypothetical protein [Phycisphaerae bacterium]